MATLSRNATSKIRVPLPASAERIGCMRRCDASGGSSPGTRPREERSRVVASDGYGEGVDVTSICTLLFALHLPCAHCTLKSIVWVPSDNPDVVKVAVWDSSPSMLDVHSQATIA